MKIQSKVAGLFLLLQIASFSEIKAATRIKAYKKGGDILIKVSRGGFERGTVETFGLLGSHLVLAPGEVAKYNSFPIVVNNEPKKIKLNFYASATGTTPSRTYCLMNKATSPNGFDIPSNARLDSVLQGADWSKGVALHIYSIDTGGKRSNARPLTKNNPGFIIVEVGGKGEFIIAGDEPSAWGTYHNKFTSNGFIDFPIMNMDLEIAGKKIKIDYNNFFKIRTSAKHRMVKSKSK